MNLKKFFIVFAASLILFTSVLVPTRSQAVAPIAVAVAKTILKGVAVKIGAELTETSLETAVDYLLAKKNKGEDDDKNIFNANDDDYTTTVLGDGTSDYNLTSDLFRLAVESLKMAMGLQVGQTVDLYNDCMIPYNTTHGTFSSGHASHNFIEFMNGSHRTLILIQHHKTTSTIVPYYTPPVQPSTHGTLFFKKFDTSGSDSSYIFRYVYNNSTGIWDFISSNGLPNPTSFQVTNQEMIYTSTNIWTDENKTAVAYSGGERNCPTVIQETQIINSTNVYNNVFNDSTTINYNYQTTYIINDTNNTPMTPEELSPIFDGQPTTEPEPTEKPVGSDWWKWLFQPITAAIEGISTLLTTLATAIADAIGAILVPSPDFFENMFSEIKAAWDGKIPFITQLSDFFKGVETVTYTNEPPSFEITMPVEWGGGTYSMFDVSYFAEWQPWIMNMIRFIAWFVFLKRLFARIPRIIGGSA